MKQKTTFITLSLVVAILALGIAYAAITAQTLNVVGNVSATASQENFKVAFSGNPSVTQTYNGDVENHENNASVSATATEHTGKFDISGLTTRGDTVTLVYTIKNSSPDLAATLTEVTVTGGSETNDAWYEVTQDLSTNSLAANGGTANLTVTVKLLDTPANDTEAPKASYYIEYKAEPVNN